MGAKRELPLTSKEMDDAAIVNERLGKSDVESLSLTMTMPPIHHEYVQERFTRSTRIRIAIAVILLVCLLLVVLDSFTTKRVESASISFFEWVEANPFRGVLSVVLVYTIATSTQNFCHSMHAISSSSSSTVFLFSLDSTVCSRIDSHNRHGLCIWDRVRHIHGSHSCEHCRLLWSFYRFSCFLSLGSLSVSRLCRSTGSVVPNLSSCRSSSSRQWTQNYDSFTTITSNSIQCFRLYEWDYCHFVVGLFSSSRGNSSWSHNVYIHRCYSIESSGWYQRSFRE